MPSPLPQSICGRLNSSRRMFPTLSLGPAHYTDADVKYKDYWIPKNTAVVLNQQGIHYDPAQFQDPEEFRPERMLENPLKAGAYAAMADANARDHFAFGAGMPPAMWLRLAANESVGRRICPGIHHAENSIFIALACMLWAFHILPPLGEDGQEIRLDVKCDTVVKTGSMAVAESYRLRLVPRSEQIEETIRREWGDACNTGLNLGDAPVTG